MDQNSALTRGRVTVGSAPHENVRGWFVGQFLSTDTGLRRRDDMELKWGAHEAGDRRAKGWSMTGTSTTVSVLLQGSFIVRFRIEGGVHEVVLNEPGDYVVYGPEIPHTWEAPEDCIVLSVRAPSVPDDETTFAE